MRFALLLLAAGAFTRTFGAAFTGGVYVECGDSGSVVWTPQTEHSTACSTATSGGSATGRIEMGYAGAAASVVVSGSDPVWARADSFSQVTGTWSGPNAEILVTWGLGVNIYIDPGLETYRAGTASSLVGRLSSSEQNVDICGGTFYESALGSCSLTVPVSEGDLVRISTLAVASVYAERSFDGVSRTGSVDALHSMRITDVIMPAGAAIVLEDGTRLTGADLVHSASTPEPSTALLLGIGFLSLGLAFRKRRSLGG